MDRFKGQKGSIMVEFAVCGIMFVGFVMGIIVLGIWMYNISQVSQAARMAALEASTTDNPAEAQQMALSYLQKTLIACPTKGAVAYTTTDDGCGVAEAYMDPLFPGFQKLIDPMGTSTINGKIHIRKEAAKSIEYRFRQGNRQQFNY